MHLPLVIDELHNKGPQELLKHLHVYSDELGVTAAATVQSGKLNLGTPKFDEDKETPVPQGGMHSTMLLYPM